MTSVNECPVAHGSAATDIGSGESRPIPGNYDRIGIRTAIDFQRNGILEIIERMWREHGDISELRVAAKRIVVLAHPDHARAVNVERMDKYTKGPSYDGARTLLIGDGLVTSVGKEWKEQRKMLSPFFTPKAVRGYAPLMMEDAEWFARRWEGRAGSHEPVEMLSEMAALTASIILKSLFSTTAQDVREQLQDAVETMIQYTSGRQLNRFRPPEWVPTPARHEYEVARQRLDEFVLHVIAERRKLPADQRPADLLSQIMSSETTLSDKLLRDQCVTMLIAGHESTARTLAFVWYVLATNPEVAATLHDEVDALPQDISLEDLKDAPYTLGVIKETLRLYPPAPIYLRDVVADDQFGPYTVKAGSTVLVAPYFTHRHREFWSEPEKFDPQRWMNDAEYGMHPYAYHPFAGGNRVCIGKNFTFMETHLLVILLARRFAPVTVPNYRPQWRMRGVLGPDNGLPMMMRGRAK
ncbi:cytochrome P450 [Nocardia tengchongensis]|uniref:cytochrome P450 n=1 Tax=Nocardia tengchongensis TaxID=2055889 RepID=UPI0033DF9C52